MLQKSYGMHVFSFFFGHITERMYSDAMFYVENEKSARRRRKHCALAVVRRNQKFRTAADPFPGARDGQNLISWRWSLSLHTNPFW